VRLHAPEIRSAVKYDPEGSMFVAYGTDRNALLTVAQLIRRAATDESVLLEALANADEDLLE
jgi:Immunity protein 51